MESFDDCSKIYGKQIVVLPASSEFEYKNLVAKVGDAKNIRILNWPDSTDSMLTMKAISGAKCLCMRGIRLTHLPPEIGLFENLEYLDIRDNYLEYLPPELSQCLKLKTLLFEGNSIFFTSQTQALNYLRQMNAAEGCAPLFKWSAQNGQFTIVSWNLMAQGEANQQLFHNTPAKYLKWEYRMEHILNITQQLKPCVLCVQEIDKKNFDSLDQRMKTIGYGSVASFPKRSRIPNLSPAGIATFYLKARLAIDRTITACFSDLEPKFGLTKIQLIENDAVFQLSLIRMQGQSFYLLNTSMYPNRYEPNVAAAQIEMLMNHVQQFSGQAIICGSFGFTPKSNAYKKIIDEDDPGPRFSEDGKQQLTYHLPKAMVTDPFTRWEDDTLDTTDYIFLSNSLYSTGTLLTSSKDDAQFYHRYMPNNQWPSSHLPIGTIVEIRISS